MIKHAVAAEGPGGGQTHAEHPVPSEAVPRQEIVDGLNPAMDDRVGAFLRIGGPLKELGGNGGPVRPDTRDFRRGCSAVRADLDVLPGAHVVVSIKDYNCWFVE